MVREILIQKPQGILFSHNKNKNCKIFGKKLCSWKLCNPDSERKIIQGLSSSWVLAPTAFICVFACLKNEDRLVN